MIRSVHQNSSSRILAAALSQSLPGLTILDAGDAFGGIFCEFIFDDPFSSEILIHLEERIRQIIREKQEIHLLDMVPFSASELLKKTGQTQRARQVMEQEGFVRLVKIGDYVDWSEGSHLRHTGEIGMIRLIDKKIIGKNAYRIVGMAALTKDEIKASIARWKRFPEIDHESLGVRLGWWQTIEDQKVWLSRGIAAQRRLCDFWRERFSTLALEVRGDERLFPMVAKQQGFTVLMQHLQGHEDSVNRRGLLDEPEPLLLEIKSFSDHEKNCISFLQTVHDSLTILGFTYRIRCFGKMRKNSAMSQALQHLGWIADVEGSGDEPILEFLVQDGLNAEWPIAGMSENRQRNVSLRVWVERNLALLLEKNGGMPPILAVDNGLQAIAGE